MTPVATRVVLVGGHESDDGADLLRFEELVPRAVAVRPGCWLHDVAMAALDNGETVVAVPMTFGRDPTMVADTARTLRWVTDRWGGAVALAAPFGVADHLTARLRAVAGAAQSRDPEAALLVAARAGSAFDDAELHRIVHLVRVHGAAGEVAVATLGPDATTGIATAVDRLRRLGFQRSLVVSAGFTADLPAADGATPAGPLMGDAAVARIVSERVAAALHDLGHGRDGIGAGLAADHDHGFAHSHDHPHPHEHPHEHSHAHDQLLPAAPGPDQQGRFRWSAGSHRTTTAPTTSRSTPAAPR